MVSLFVLIESGTPLYKDFMCAWTLMEPDRTNAAVEELWPLNVEQNQTVTVSLCGGAFRLWADVRASTCFSVTPEHVRRTLSTARCTDALYLGVWSVFSRWFWGHTWWCVFTSAPPDLDLPAHTHILSQQALRQKPPPPSSVTSSCSSSLSNDHILWKQWGGRCSSSSRGSQSDHSCRRLHK